MLLGHGRATPDSLYTVWRIYSFCPSTKIAAALAAAAIDTERSKGTHTQAVPKMRQEPAGVARCQTSGGLNQSPGPGSASAKSSLVSRGIKA